MSLKALDSSVIPSKAFSQQDFRDCTIGDALKWGQQQLKVLGKVEALASCECLLEDLLGVDRLRLYLESKTKLSRKDLKNFFVLVEKRRSRIPLDYLLGKTHFWNEVLEVGPGCLIPRPSTEVLVETFIEKSGFSRDRMFSFLDLGCGSGAIGLALLRHYPKAKATCADISKSAIGLTRKNLKRYGLLKRADLRISDLFQKFDARSKWDVVFSNPPYLSADDLKKAQPEVLKEPWVALDGGRDGLDLYRKIALQTPRFLKPKGWLVLEMGKGQAAAISSFFKKNFHSIEIYKDYAKIDRVLMAKFNG